MKHYDDGKNGKINEIEKKQIFFNCGLIDKKYLNRVSLPNEPDIILKDGTTIEIKSNAGELRTYATENAARNAVENETITTVKKAKYVVYTFDSGETFVLKNKQFITALKNANAIRYKLKSDKITSCVTIKSYMKTANFNGLTKIKNDMLNEMNKNGMTLKDFCEKMKKQINK